jgi:hypothetical protein
MLPAGVGAFQTGSNSRQAGLLARGMQHIQGGGLLQLPLHLGINFWACAGGAAAARTHTERRTPTARAASGASRPAACICVGRAICLDASAMAAVSGACQRGRGSVGALIPGDQA